MFDYTQVRIERGERKKSLLYCTKNNENPCLTLFLVQEDYSAITVTMDEVESLGETIVAA